MALHTVNILSIKLKAGAFQMLRGVRHSLAVHKVDMADD